MDVTMVTSGEACLKALAARPDTDVVVLDISMPGMNGLETLAVIRKQYPLVQTILYTGNPTPENGIQGQELGAFYFLTKPAHMEELVDLLHSAKARKQRKAEQVSRLAQSAMEQPQ
jgi:DNA-binding NtrC family response regulator